MYIHTYPPHTYIPIFGSHNKAVLWRMSSIEHGVSWGYSDSGKTALTWSRALLGASDVFFWWFSFDIMSLVPFMMSFWP